MATTTVFEKRQDNPQVVSGFATIDANETATLAIPCHGRAKVFLGIPGTFTGTSLTFTVQPFPPSDTAAPTLDPPFRQLRDKSGNIVTATVAANRALEVPELGGCYAFTIVSGSSEAAAREIEVECVGPYPVAGAGSSGSSSSTISPSTGTLTDKSGTIAAGGTQQTLAAVNASRKYLFIQNTDASEDLWVNFTTNAVRSQPSVLIPPRSSMTWNGTFITTQLVSVIATTTGHTFTAKEG